MTIELILVLVFSWRNVRDTSSKGTPSFLCFYVPSSIIPSVSASRAAIRQANASQGILFLTTNRVGAFDPAFKSRIHLSLFYPRLDYEATMKVWSMHIDRTNGLFRAKSQPFKIKRDQILDFAKKHFEELNASRVGCWNGRQIRNAFQTAIALAEYKAQATGREPVLSADHFEDVAKASFEFDDYLRLTLGMNEQDKAHHYNYRYDAFEDRKDSIAGPGPRNSIGGSIHRVSRITLQPSTG